MHIRCSHVIADTPWYLKRLKRWYLRLDLRCINPASLKVWKLVDARLSDLAGVVLGAAIALSIVDGQHLLQAIHVAPGVLGPVSVMIMYVFRIYLGLLLWPLYFRAYYVVKLSPQLFGEWFYIAKTTPLFFALLYAASLANVPLLNWQGGSTSPSDAALMTSWSWLALAACFLTLGLVCRICACFKEMEQSLAVECAANIEFAAHMTLTLFAGAAVPFVNWLYMSFPVVNPGIYEAAILVLLSLGAITTIRGILRSNRLRTGKMALRDLRAYRNKRSLPAPAI